MNSEMLRLWRAKERLSQAEAGRLFEVTRQTIGEWEKGRVPHDFDARFLRAAHWLLELKEEKVNA